MASESLESRVAALEADMARLRAQMDKLSAPDKPWWHKIYGSFANDPLYEEAMRLGRKYRESLRPKPKRKRV